MDYRKSKFYKELDIYTACAYAEGFCEGENATDIQIITAWQWIKDKELYRQLPGWYGRTVQGLLEQDIIA